MFMGRMREPGGEAAPIVGGKRVAAALRGLWLLTGNDNPYADWLTLPLFRVALNPRFTRPFYAVPRTSAARTASG